MSMREYNSVQTGKDGRQMVRLEKGSLHRQLMRVQHEVETWPRWVYDINSSVYDTKQRNSIAHRKNGKR